MFVELLVFALLGSQVLMKLSEFGETLSTISQQGLLLLYTYTSQFLAFLDQRTFNRAAPVFSLFLR